METVGNGIRVVRAWDGGPLRQFAATKLSGAFIPYAKSINGHHFAGRYVCDGCQQPSNGVRRQNDGRLSGNGHSRWLCDPCFEGRERKVRTEEQKQALIDRLAAARRDRGALQGTGPAVVCDNASCFNPRHLIDGANRDNVYDREMKKQGAILIDALAAGAAPTAGQPNLGTEEHEQ
jgi:hypothetical protein